MQDAQIRIYFIFAYVFAMLAASPSLIIRPFNEPGMIEIRISGISLKIDLVLLYINGARNQFIPIDMTFDFIFRQGLPGKCLHKSNKT